MVKKGTRVKWWLKPDAVPTKFSNESLSAIIIEAASVQLQSSERFVARFSRQMTLLTTLKLHEFVEINFIWKNLFRLMWMKAEWENLGTEKWDHWWILFLPKCSKIEAGSGSVIAIMNAYWWIFHASSVNVASTAQQISSLVWGKYVGLA